MVQFTRMCGGYFWWYLHSFFLFLIALPSHASEQGNPIGSIPEELRHEIRRYGLHRELLHAIDMADITAVRALIIRGCGAEVINAHNPQSWGPIIQTAAGRSASIMRLLLHNGGNPNSTDKDNYTALMYAASRNNLAMLDVLLEHGAEVNAAGSAGGTALHSAVFSNRSVAIALLCRAGAELDAEHTRKGTPLEFACMCGRAGAMSELVQRGAQLPGKDAMVRMSVCIQKILHEHRWRYQIFLLQQFCSIRPQLPSELCCLLLTFVNGDRCQGASPCSGIVSQ